MVLNKKSNVQKQAKVFTHIKNESKKRLLQAVWLWKSLVTVVIDTKLVMNASHKNSEDIA